MTNLDELPNNVERAQAVIGNAVANGVNSVHAYVQALHDAGLLMPDGMDWDYLTLQDHPRAPWNGNPQYPEYFFGQQAGTVMRRLVGEWEPMP